MSQMNCNALKRIVDMKSSISAIERLSTVQLSYFERESGKLFVRSDFPAIKIYSDKVNGRFISLNGISLAKVG